MSPPPRKRDPNAKLSDEKAREIRGLYGTACTCCGHRLDMPVLGRRYGVSAAAIHKVLHGDSYRGAAAARGGEG